MNVKFSLWIALLLAQICIMRVSTAGPLINGDFETGDLSGWFWQPTEHAEPQMTADVVDFNTTTSVISREFRVNPGGDQSYASGSSGGGTLSQDVFLTAGATYQITLDTAIQCVLPLPNLSTGAISLYLGDVPIGVFGPGSIEGSAVLRTTFSGMYVPQDSSYYRIALVFDRQFGNWGTNPYTGYPTPRIYDYVDNISLVPEPASLPPLTIGGLSLLAKRRRA